MREMKDSGLPWLGIVPLKWEVRKVKHYYRMQTGFTPNTKNDDFYDDLNGKDWVTIGDLCDSRFIPPNTSRHVSKKYIDNSKDEKLNASIKEQIESEINNQEINNINGNAFK